MIRIEPPMRGTDKHGSGYFGAPRGSKTHRGIDYACYKGSRVLSFAAGEVTHWGYPYNPTDEAKGHLRYVEITDAEGYQLRYFYVMPSVYIGDQIFAGEPIGETQGLMDIFPDITDHFHFEVKRNGAYIAPAQWPPAIGTSHA